MALILCMIHHKNSRALRAKLHFDFVSTVRQIWCRRIWGKNLSERGICIYTINLSPTDHSSLAKLLLFIWDLHRSKVLTDYLPVDPPIQILNEQQTEQFYFRLRIIYTHIQLTFIKVYSKYLLVIVIAKCQRAKILPIRTRCLICSEM